MVDRFPETIERKPKVAISDLLSGIMVVKPANIIPKLPKLAKPHSA